MAFTNYLNCPNKFSFDEQSSISKFLVWCLEQKTEKHVFAIILNAK